MVFTDPYPDALFCGSINTYRSLAHFSCLRVFSGHLMTSRDISFAIILKNSEISACILPFKAASVMAFPRICRTIIEMWSSLTTCRIRSGQIARSLSALQHQAFPLYWLTHFVVVTAIHEIYFVTHRAHHTPS